MSLKIVVVDAGRLPPGVELLAFPDTDCDDAHDAQDLCNRIAQAIDYFAVRGATHGTGL